MNKLKYNKIIFNKKRKSYLNIYSFKEFSTIFNDIINKKIPAEIIYESENILAFKDIAPVAPIHYLIIPKKEIKSVSLSSKNDISILGEMIYSANIIAKKLNIDNDGYRLVINDGRNGCQSINHIHIHLIGGKQLSWPPGVEGNNKKI